jgi:hypothetical protein
MCCINPRKTKLKSKQIIFGVSDKTSVIRKKSKGRKNVRVGYGARAVIRLYGSAEPEPKEIFTAPQQWLPQTSVPDPWHFGVDPDPDPRIHASN